MRNILFLTTSIVIGLFLWSCTKKECKEYRYIDYNFRLPVFMAANTQQKKFNIGDTLTITSEFNHDVLDINTNQVQILDDYNFMSFIKIALIDSIPIIDGFQYCEIVSIIAEEYVLTPILSGGLSILNYQYIFQDKRYSFSFRFIPRKKGIYFLGFGSGISLERPHVQDFPGKCGDRTVDVNYFMNDGTDNNFSIFSNYQSNDEFLNKLSENDYIKVGGITFEVQ